MKLACATCHPAAAASTLATDNLLPSRQVCLGCHQESELPAPWQPMPTRVAFFSHAQHLKMGNVAPVIAAAIDRKTYLQPPGDIRARLNTQNPCEACHRGLEESAQAGRAVMPQMADCLVCHTKIDPPFSCEECHGQDAHLKPASHTPEFLDTHTNHTLHFDKSTCAVCHGVKFTCMGCH